MSGVPQPYPNGTRLLVENQVLVVTDHAPHAEDWRYTGHPVNVTGSEVHFSHHQAGPVPASMLPPSARSVFERNELDDDLTVIVADAPALMSDAATLALAALTEWYHGWRSNGELRSAALEYLERGTWGAAT